MAGAIGGRLYQLQVLDSEAFRARAQNQHQRRVESAPTRGTIVDREGRSLAVSLEVQSLYAHPRRVESPDASAKLLAPLLDVPRAKLATRLRSDRPFVYLKRFLEPGTADRIREAGLPLGAAAPFGFLRESRRVYPRGPLAVHVLGFANIDGVGVEGIEQRYDEVLRGDPATYFVTRDARNRLVRSGIDAPGRQPKHVVLTLDAVLQHRVERELEQAMRDTGAKAASAILLDPRNGHVLALANRPAVDANRYGRGTDEQRHNRAMVGYYEPGSTFKPVPLAIALDSGAVHPNQNFDCENGVWRTSKRRIRDTSPQRTLSLRQVLAKSSNIGMAKAVRPVRRDALHRGIERFGFGSKTGIELPGESAGLLRDVPKWSDFTQASLSFGQEIGVTVLQMASAIGTIANDGVRVPPRIVLGTRDHDGRLEPARAPTPARVIRSVTAAQVRSMMVSVIESGTGTRAGIEGHALAGKSGTAQKAVKGGYSETDYMASFGGFGPAEDPVVVAMVVLDSPRGEWIHGGQVAAPVFRRIMAAALPHLRVPAASDPEPVPLEAADTMPPQRRATLDTPGGTVPQLAGLSLREAVGLLAQRGYRAMVQGDGAVVSQRPPPGTPLGAGEVCRIELGSGSAVGGPAAAGGDEEGAP